MKKVFLFLWLFLAGILAAQPVIRYDAAGFSNGRIANSAGDKYPAVVTGKVRVTPQKTIELDGSSTDTTILGSEKIDLHKGITFMMLYKRHTRPGDKPIDYNHDMFLYRSKQFLFGRTRNRFYTNFCGNDKKFYGPSYSQQIMPDDGKFHHIALTFIHRKVPAHGIDQIESRVYMDGILVHQADQKNRFMRSSTDTPLELACGRSFGNPWRLGGEIADVRLYQRILSAGEIKKIVAEQKLAKPAFRVPEKLSAAEQKQISAIKEAGVREGLKALAMNGRKIWKKAAASPAKMLLSLPGKKSTLTLLTSPGEAGIISWFDLEKKRELLRWDNCFFELILLEKGKPVPYAADDPEVRTELVSAPRNKGKVCQFSLLYTHPKWSARVDFSWVDDRLEYRISPKSKLPVVQLNSPQVRINAFNRGKCRLLTPDDIGRVLDASVSTGAAYAGLYPGRRAGMQLGAFYDDDGGVFASSGDPLARISMFGMSGGRDGAEINFKQYISRDGENRSCAVLELFRGDWNDAADCYSRLLDRMDPVWNRGMVGYPTPDWLKRNTLNVYYAYGNESDAQLVQLRKYFGLPFIVTVEGSHIRGEKYLPDIRLHPDMAAIARKLQKHGIRVQLYTNARMVQEYCNYMSQKEFEKKIMPDAARLDGLPVFEHYPDTFGRVVVLCPMAPWFRRQVHGFSLRYASQGIDGIYLDQFGCTSAILCSAANHGHKPYDPDAWFYKGQRQQIGALRQLFKEKGLTEKYFSNECNGEIVVGLSDMGTPWGALYDDQVPLFHKVYAGKIQNGYRDRVGESEGASFAKDADQILIGEQLGRINSRNLVSPLRFDYRSYLKRLMHLRIGMLDYFNSGKMLRAPRQEPEPRRIPQFWGIWGSRIVSKPPVLTAAWMKGDKTAVIAVNTTAEKQETTLCFELDNVKTPLTLYTAGGKKTQVKARKNMKFRCTLEPYSLLVLTNRPDAAMDKAFKVISRTFTEEDPFAFNAANYPAKALVLNKEYRAVDSHVSGAQRAVARNEINYVYYGVVYPGILDFGKGGAETVELLLAAAPESGDGRVRIFIDAVKPENEIFSFPLASNFHTANWRDFKVLKGKLSRKVSGKHKIFFCFSGSSVCNFRSWKMY